MLGFGGHGVPCFASRTRQAKKRLASARRGLPQVGSLPLRTGHVRRVVHAHGRRVRRHPLVFHLRVGRLGAARPVAGATSEKREGEGENVALHFNIFLIVELGIHDIPERRYRSSTSGANSHSRRRRVRRDRANNLSALPWAAAVRRGWSVASNELARDTVFLTQHLLFSTVRSPSE
jgi:hypothetical protein